MAFGGLLLLGARAGDLLGRQRTFILGIGPFSAASLAVGLAQSETGMIAARAVHGVGAAALAPSTLEPRRRLLFHGPPGCGKTLAAAVLAGELGLPLLRVRIETLFSRYLGQTAALLSAVFEEMHRVRGVYLFDEFDALGRQRFAANDVGEASRVVSTFLQLLDADDSGAIIVAATNGAGEIDHAAFRRFDDVALAPLPAADAIGKLLRLRTTGHKIAARDLDALARRLKGLSFAEADRVVTEALKAMVLDGCRRLTAANLRASADRVRARTAGPGA